MRLGRWWCAVLAAGFVLAAGVAGILAVQQLPDISAYHRARACPAGAPASAGCLRTAVGSVVGVDEIPGGAKVPARYELDVRTASTTLTLSFASDSLMLGSALDGDRAVVTVWDGVPVSVATRGRLELTKALVTGSARSSGIGVRALGVGVFFVLAAVSVRQNRRRGDLYPLAVPVLMAGVPALAGAGIVVAFSVPPSPGSWDLAATIAALAVVLGLCAWVGTRIRRQAG